MSHPDPAGDPFPSNEPSNPPDSSQILDNLPEVKISGDLPNENTGKSFLAQLSKVAGSTEDPAEEKLKAGGEKLKTEGEERQEAEEEEEKLTAEQEKLAAEVAALTKPREDDRLSKEGETPPSPEKEKELKQLVEFEKEKSRVSIRRRPTLLVRRDTSSVRNEAGEALWKIMEDEDLEELGQLIGKKGKFHEHCLESYVSMFNFHEMRLDEALRAFLSGFVLPVEAQQIDRIMEKFSQRYHSFNPETFSHPDTAYVLSFSIIMLNTDLHNPSVKNKMTKADFIRNNRQIDQGKDLPKAILEEFYDNIKAEEFKYPTRRRTARRPSLESKPPPSASNNPTSPKSPELNSSLWMKIGTKFKAFGKTPSPGGVFFTPGAGEPTHKRTKRTTSYEAPSSSLAPPTSLPPAAPPASITTSLLGSMPGSGLPSASPTSPNLLHRTLSDQPSHSTEVFDEITLGVDARPLQRSDSAPGDLSLLVQSHFLATEKLRRSSAAKRLYLPLRRTASTSCVESSTTIFKRPVRSGMLVKKNDTEPDGRKSKVRSWRPTWVVLRGFSLLLFSGDLDGSHQANPNQVRLEKVIPLRDAFCLPEDSYTKREFVFRLVTGSLQSLLFEAPSMLQLSEWMHAINHQAAICTALYLENGLSTTATKVQVLRRKLTAVQKKVDIEAAYRNGIDRLIGQYKGGKNRAMLTQAYHEFQKWEGQMQHLLEERKKYAVYVGMVEDMSPECVVGLEYHSPFAR